MGLIYRNGVPYGGGGSDIDQFIGTTAEWNALPDEDKNKYIDREVILTDDGSGSSGKEVYSTEETIVGTWIDGKPLYRKVFTVPESNWATAGQLNTLNIDFDFSDKNFIQASGSIKRSDGFEHQLGSHYSTLVVHRGATKPFDIYCYQWGTEPGLLASLVFIIEYTKTTD